MMGWHVRVLPGWDAAALWPPCSASIETADFGDGEREEPECVLLVSRRPSRTPIRVDWQAEARAAHQIAARRCFGMRARHVVRARESSQRRPRGVGGHRRRGRRHARDRGIPASPASRPRVRWPARGIALRRVTGPVAASRLFLQRRSARPCPATARSTSTCSARCCSRLLPRRRAAVGRVLRGRRACISCCSCIVSHGLEPGLYVLARTPAALRRCCGGELRDDFAWIRPPACPTTCRSSCSCRLDVRRRRRAELPAGHRGRRVLQRRRCWPSSTRRSTRTARPFYRCLFWEAGMIGHLLYLEAEAAGVRGTGIGCYFDDSVHDLLGIDEPPPAEPLPLHRRACRRRPAAADRTRVRVGAKPAD